MFDMPLRRRIVTVAQDLVQLGLNKGAAGNVSARRDDGFLITPSGMVPDRMLPADIVGMDMAGVWKGPRKPSSEWRFHQDILAARPDVGAIIHTHAPFCTTLAVYGRGIPAFHYMVAAAGGKDIRCAPYATFGTQDLSNGAVTALEGRKACLLAHHGMIALGSTLDEALALTVEVETLAEIYWRTLAIGEPPILDDSEMNVVLEKFRSYGQHAQTGHSS
ncbi:MAG: class II aldolase/adducin family protein [Rhodospirillales bacterium]|nr:class II aldolase/adducin family protein [Rhodospirillales bacterium]